MSETKTYYENGEWHEYESLWDGRELLPPYNSRSITAATIEAMRAQKKDRRAPKEGYRLNGRIRRKRKDAA